MVTKTCEASGIQEHRITLHSLKSNCYIVQFDRSELAMTNNVLWNALAIKASMASGQVRSKMGTTINFLLQLCTPLTIEGVEFIDNFTPPAMSARTIVRIFSFSTDMLVCMHIAKPSEN